jgi:nitroreductase
MEIAELVKRTRSYRRFYQDHEIDFETLKELIGLARLSASAANRQPLRFICSHYHEKNALIFSYLAWAGYLKDWEGPGEGERPSAYIIILSNMNISKSVDCDHGIAAHSILLGATARGLGGCMIAAIKKEGLRIALNIPVHYEILLVVALGKPKEEVVIEEVGPDEDIKYWRDGRGVHHVPKRSLDDLILDL